MEVKKSGLQRYRVVQGNGETASVCYVRIHVFPRRTWTQPKVCPSDHDYWCAVSIYRFIGTVHCNNVMAWFFFFLVCVAAKIKIRKQG